MLVDKDPYTLNPKPRACARLHRCGNHLPTRRVVEPSLLGFRSFRWFGTGDDRYA